MKGHLFTEWAHQAYENRGLLLLLAENAMGRTRHGSLLGFGWNALALACRPFSRRLDSQPKPDPGKIPEDKTKERNS